MEEVEESWRGRVGIKILKVGMRDKNENDTGIQNPPSSFKSLSSFSRLSSFSSFPSYSSSSVSSSLSPTTTNPPPS